MNYGEVIDSVKEHLWRDATGDTSLPESIIHTHLQQAIRFIEGRRKWFWLENLRTSMSVTTRRVQIPTGLKSIVSISRLDTNDRVPLEQLSLTDLRDKYADDDYDEPVEFAVIQDEIFLGPAPSATLPAELEIIYSGYHPAIALTDDGKATTNTLLTDYPLALIYRACHTLAAGYLKDDEDALRYSGLFGAELSNMEDADDEYRASLYGGNIEPDTYHYYAAFGGNIAP